MTKNQKAHLQTIGSIIGSIIVFVLLIMVISLSPGTAFALVFLAAVVSIGYVIYMMFFEHFKQKG